MTEIGAWGFELADAPGGLCVNEGEFIAEVIDPETERPVHDGEAGELVLTNLGRIGSPLIRYRTGDRVRLVRPKRGFARAEGGVLGRIDDMLIIRGNNVFPATIEGIVREFDDVVEFRLHVSSAGSMNELSIKVEPRAWADARGLAESIVAAVRDRLHFQPLVSIAAPGTLPRFEMKARRLVRD
jgi:phenylacetate-CoA ligase